MKSICPYCDLPVDPPLWYHEAGMGDCDRAREKYGERAIKESADSHTNHSPDTKERG